MRTTKLKKRGTGAHRPAPAYGGLYERPVKARRTGPLFSAFPYPTKISPETIALFIASHTKPGDVVLDGFAGSGTTGLGALLCADPPPELRAEADKLGLPVRWGPRKAVLYELGELGAFLGKTLTNPPDPTLFRETATRLLEEAEAADGWMYAATDPAGRDGCIRHLIWSDKLQCPACLGEVSLWDAAVRRNPAAIGPAFSCPRCRHETSLNDVERLTSTAHDDLLDQPHELRKRQPAFLYGATGSSTWSRAITADDMQLIERISDEPLPDAVPVVPIQWGDLYRRGYHQGITHLHHFYARRNLIVFARLWERAGEFGGSLGDALLFWLLSYNAAHSTIMTRVVAKAGQKDLVVTSGQPGVLYVSGLPVEKNLFNGLRRKLTTIAKAFEVTYGRRGQVTVHCRSCRNLRLTDGSVDYVFTDPPFGGNIPYSEVNFINEAWLGKCTDPADEITVSPYQGKTADDYRSLMADALCELHRVLKDDGRATVIFHSATAEIWNALQDAYNEAGFSVERASVLDKLQGSFKQVTTNGAVKGDPSLLLAKRPAVASASYAAALDIARQLLSEAEAFSDPQEQSPQRLYSRFISYYLTRHQAVPLDAHAFYHWLETHGSTNVSDTIAS